LDILTGIFKLDYLVVMDLIELLEKFDRDILDKVVAAMAKYRLKHYDGDVQQLHRRMALLYDYVDKSVREENVMPMVLYVEQMAEKRFLSGFDLQEVQTAFNVLEEFIWKYILENVKPGLQAEALGLISSIIGSGKDTLARTYLKLASVNH